MFICKTCGIEFVSKDTRKNRTRVFCSQRCMGEFNKKKDTISGLHCGKSFIQIGQRRPRKFCSFKCSTEYKRGERANNWKGGKTNLICIVCGSEYRISQYMARSQRCCSRKCRGIYQSSQSRHIRAKAEYMKRYYVNNPGKHATYAQRRKAKAHKLPARLTSEQWERIKRCFNDKSAYCGMGLPLEQEHFIPVNRGGEYAYDNIVPSCKRCNSLKNVQDFFQWFPSQAFYNETRERKILKHLNYKNRTQQLSIN